MSSTTSDSWILELYFPERSSTLKARLDEKLVIGRSDPDVQLEVDVDLDMFDAENLGVSRQHLQLNVQDEQLMVTDLNSGNGTLLNNEPLTPGKPYPVQHNDRLQLGKLTFELHVVISPTYGSTMHKHASLQLQDQAAPAKGQLIMIVEDDAEVSKLLALILERAGYTTVISRDVISAIRIFRMRRPAAVVLDLSLPDISGLEFCRYVRRDTQNSTTPMIVVSALNTTENVEKAMEAGADIFLSKPLSTRELRHVLASLIAQREQGVAALNTKRLIATAPLQAMTPETRHDAAVIFVSGHSDTPLTLSLKQPVTLGRQTTKADKTHVDLTRFSAVDFGVSRVHAQLQFKEGKFLVRDNNSVNGTFVNGEPLRPDTLKELSNADEIRLGQLRMYIYFLTDAERGG